MSLKAVHLFFVVVLSAFCFGMGIMKLREYLDARGPTDLLFSAGAFLAGVLVIWYGRRVYLKLKSVSYL